MNAQQVKKNLDFTAIILNQPCDWNQQSEQLVFIERKDTERNRHVKEVFTNFFNDFSEAVAGVAASCNSYGKDQLRFR